MKFTVLTLALPQRTDTFFFLIFHGEETVDASPIQPCVRSASFSQPCSTLFPPGFIFILNAPPSGLVYDSSFLVSGNHNVFPSSSLKYLKSLFRVPLFLSPRMKFWLPFFVTVPKCATIFLTLTFCCVYFLFCPFSAPSYLCTLIDHR